MSYKHTKVCTSGIVLNTETVQSKPESCGIIRETPHRRRKSGEGKTKVNGRVYYSSIAHSEQLI